jgi:heme oxygenase
LVNTFNPDWRDLHDEIDGDINAVEEFATRKVFREQLMLVGGPRESGP